MFINERTRQEVEPPKAAGSLVLGRREGEGVLVEVGGQAVVIIVEETRTGKCALRFLCAPGVQVNRIKPVSHQG